MTVEWLARLQFMLAVSFHYFFPPLTLGLGVCMLISQGLYLKSGQLKYHQMTQFWMRIFTVIFSVGAASGFILKYEFSTRWTVYNHFIHQFFSNAATTEAINSFLIEASLITILLYSWKQLNRFLYFVLLLIAVVIPHFNAAWIVIVNSWQQTPQGFKIIGQGAQAYAHILDYQAMLFNPSSIQRISHVFTAAWLTGSCLLSSLGAYYFLRKKHLKLAITSLNIGLPTTAIFTILHLLTGHLSAVCCAEHQPVKLAAMEGHFDSQQSANLYLFGWIDEKNHHTYGLYIPKGLSFLAKGHWNDKILGLNQIEKINYPPLNLVFQTYHLMVILGLGIILFNIIGLWVWYSKKICKRLDYQDKKYFIFRHGHQTILKGLQFIFLLPIIANQVGWYTTEIGRQPWLVYGLLRTTHGLTPSLKAHELQQSLVYYTMFYFALGVIAVLMLVQLIQKGPLFRQRVKLAKLDSQFPIKAEYVDSLL